MSVEELMAECGMKKGHAKILRKWLDDRARRAALADDPSPSPRALSATEIVAARGTSVWDMFLSHYQAESGDIVALVRQ
jgi:hypothetical protein